MPTIEDCIGIYRLSEDGVAAFVEHEHLPDIILLEMGNYLFITAEGQQRLSRMIVDDTEEVMTVDDLGHAAKMRRGLQHVLEHHAGIAFTTEQKAWRC